MLVRLFFLFTAVPLVELYFLLWMARQMGFAATLGLVLFTGALGAWLARSQGLATLKAIRAEHAHGRLPAGHLVDGLLILIAGAVLLTPGLLTDLAGFFLLIPAGRRLIRDAVRRSIEAKIKQGKAQGRVIVVDHVDLDPRPNPDDPTPLEAAPPPQDDATR